MESGFSETIAQRIENDSDWKALKSHIEFYIDLLNRHDDVDFTDKEKASITCLGRQEARRILEAVLDPFTTKPEDTTNNKDLTAKKTGML